MQWIQWPRGSEHWLENQQIPRIRPSRITDWLGPVTTTVSPCVGKVPCTIPTPSIGSPSDEELYDLAVNIPEEWYQLLIYVGLRKGAVDDILHDLRFARPSDKAFQALVVWRNSSADNATYEKLAKTLQKLGRHDLVQEFCIDQVSIGL